MGITYSVIYSLLHTGGCSAAIYQGDYDEDILKKINKLLQKEFGIENIEQIEREYKDGDTQSGVDFKIMIKNKLSTSVKEELIDLLIELHIPHLKSSFNACLNNGSLLNE
jgi:ferredoxin-fold anticodon binding domain-containing protein